MQIMFTLVTFKKNGTRQEIPLKSGSITIGRKPDADVRIPVNEVSRAHCQLALNGTKATLRDLGSSNGTFVNDRRVTEALLNAGDQITVGPVTFILQVDGKPADIVRPSSSPGRKAIPASPTERTVSKQPEAGKKPAGSKPQAGKGAAQDSDIDEFSDMDLDDLSDLDFEADDVEIDADFADFLAEDEPKNAAPKGKGPEKGKK
jgi:pSer/pThr/pTyr-binding forkhead associated (FHA) protein